MEKKFIKRISLNGLKKVLGPKEMKNITGGSGDRICGWIGSSQTPCLVSWEGDCGAMDCDSFFNSQCPKYTKYSWCAE